MPQVYVTHSNSINLEYKKSSSGAFFLVSISMIDTVTVVFQDELDSLRRQAQSLDLYVNDIQTVFIVVNEDSDLEQQINLQWWGRWSGCVKIVTRNRFGLIWSDNGWVSQQVLKLLAASIAPSNWSIILDAKTFFVKQAPNVKDRPRVGLLPIYPVFEPSRQIVNQLFDIDLKQQLGPGGVPFVMNTQQVRDMIAWIESAVNRPFATWFQDQGRLTEFLLYTGWIQYHTGALGQIYDLDQVDLIPCNLCHSEIGSFDHKFKEMHNSTTVSIHRRAWTQLLPEQQTQYTDFLASRGIT